jgi:hypothetical protein
MAAVGPGPRVVEVGVQAPEQAAETTQSRSRGRAPRAAALAAIAITAFFALDAAPGALNKGLPGIVAAVRQTMTPPSREEAVAEPGGAGAPRGKENVSRAGDEVVGSVEGRLEPAAPPEFESASPPLREQGDVDAALPGHDASTGSLLQAPGAAPPREHLPGAESVSSAPEPKDAPHAREASHERLKSEPKATGATRGAERPPIKRTEPATAPPGQPSTAGVIAKTGVTALDAAPAPPIRPLSARTLPKREKAAKPRKAPETAQTAPDPPPQPAEPPPPQPAEPAEPLPAEPPASAATPGNPLLRALGDSFK